MSEDNRSSNSILAFILGALAGAVAGVLLAPRSGEESREILSDWLTAKRKETERIFEKEVRHAKKQMKAAYQSARESLEGDDRV